MKQIERAGMRELRHHEALYNDATMTPTNRRVVIDTMT